MSLETQAEYVREDFIDRSRDAEQLLVEVVHSGRTELLTSERAYLAREMSWSAEDIRKQLRRVMNVVRLQRIAGSPEDREAVLQECQTAADLLAKEEPKIQQKIRELEGKLNSLRRDATTSQKRAESQSEAVEQLRRLCPIDIVERVSAATRAIEAGIGQDLRDAKARHHELKCILNVGNVYDSPQKHLEFGLQNLLPAAVTIGVDGHRLIRRGYAPEWPQLKAECEAELAELEQRLPELQDTYDAAIQAAELPLDFYSSGQKDE